MAALASAIAIVTATTVAAAALGAPILSRGFTFRHPALQWAAGAALGFQIVAGVVGLLVLSGRATPGPLRVVLAGLSLTAVVSLARQARALRRGRWLTFVAHPRALTIGLCGALYTAWTVLCVTLPPLSTDELNHHLAVPRTMLAAGGGAFFPDNIYAYFPPLGEMLFLFGLGVGGEMTARLFHAAFGAIVGAALYGFSRCYLPAAAAPWSVVIFFTVPSVMVILPTAYVDLIFTAYAFLSVIMLIEFFESRRIRWAALCGVMASGALLTKYTGLQLLLLLAFLVLIEHLIARRRGMPAAAVALLGAGVGLALPLFWRNWSITGWPLFPFALGALPIAPAINWDAERASMFLTMLSSYGSGASPLGPARLLDAVAAPVLVFLQARFNDPRLYDGVVGPIFLLTPVVLWRAGRSTAVTTLAAFSVLFLLYWALTIRQVRFLIPVLPAISVLLTMGLWQQRRRVISTLALVFVITSAGTGVARVLSQRPLPFWIGKESREQYLAARLPVFAIYQAANRRLGPGDRVYLINMRNLGYYLDPAWRADFVFEYYGVEQQLAAANPDLPAFFRAQAISHVLIDESATFAPGVLDPGQSAALRQFLDHEATLLDRINGHALFSLAR